MMHDMTKKLKDIWLVITGHLSWDIAATNKIAYMVASSENDWLRSRLRSIDQGIFNLSQCTDQASMQRILGPLVDEVMKRKDQESKRISSMLIPELERTYGNTNQG